MEQLNLKIDEIERLFRVKKDDLKKSKLIALFMLSGLCLYTSLSVFAKKVVQKLSFEESIIAIVVFLVIILLPIILLPLFKFFGDKINDKIARELKLLIFETSFNKYNASFSLSFDNLLPDSDIENLNLENGLTKFAYGDDLIVGEINNIPFRISEMHTFGLSVHNFDGIIGVLLFENISVTDKIELSKYITTSKMEVVVKDNKIYLLKRRKSKLFEFKIAKGKVNRSELFEDFKSFDELVHLMNEITLKHNSKSTKFEPLIS